MVSTHEAQTQLSSSCADLCSRDEVEHSLSQAFTRARCSIARAPRRRRPPSRNFERLAGGAPWPARDELLEREMRTNRAHLVGVLATHVSTPPSSLHTPVNRYGYGVTGTGTRGKPLCRKGFRAYGYGLWAGRCKCNDLCIHARGTLTRAYGYGVTAGRHSAPRRCRQSPGP